MITRNSKTLIACILISFASSASLAEVCQTPDRLTPPMQAPCYTSPSPGTPSTTSTPATIYGPWLSTCSGTNSPTAYYPRFEQALTDAVESRITELSSGADRAWDATIAGTPSVTFPAFCDLTQGTAGSSCTSLVFPTLTDQSTPTDRILRVDEPATAMALKSYRLGAWIESMRQFEHEVVAEVKGAGTLSVSPSCKTIRDYIADTLSRLGPTAFALQPNIQAIENDQDPCPSYALGGTPELDQLRAKLIALPSVTAAHYNPEIVLNRMSGCLMIAARKQIETAFVQLAACEVRVRATAVDREFFIAGSCSSPISKSTTLSVFDQLIQEQVLKADCETKAYSACTGAGLECLTDPGFDLNDPSCWTCFSTQMQACFKKDLPTYLGPAGSPTPLVSLATGNLVTNFRALSSMPSNPARAKYSFTGEGCTADPLTASPIQIQGCPNIASDLMYSGAKFALDNFQSLIDAANVTLSPLNSSLDLDSSKKDPGRGVATPLDDTGNDFGPATVFPGTK